MRTKLMPSVFVALLACNVALAQPEQGRPAKEFMRDKLQLSQKLLEAVATEDWDLVAANGTKLSAMTGQADWRVFQNPNYDQQSKLFKQQVDSLVRAAKKKDIDAATLAYVRMTISCVDCHKLVRGKLVASVR